MKKILVGLLAIGSFSALAGEFKCNELKIHFSDFQAEGSNCNTVKCIEQALPEIGNSKIEDVRCVTSESGNWVVPTVRFSDLETRSSISEINGDYICYEYGVHFLDDGSCSTMKCVEDFKKNLSGSSLLSNAKVTSLNSKCEKSSSGNWDVPIAKYTLKIRNL